MPRGSVRSKHRDRVPDCVPDHCTCHRVDLTSGALAGYGSYENRKGGRHPANTRERARYRAWVDQVDGVAVVLFHELKPNLGRGGPTAYSGLPVWACWLLHALRIRRQRSGRPAPRPRPRRCRRRCRRADAGGGVDPGHSWRTAPGGRHRGGRCPDPVGSCA
jgi:hypothetical protein